MIDLGASLGIFEFRGHLLAPQNKQQICMSVLDFLQHMAVIGGTGEGKSRELYIPIMRQLLELRRGGLPIAFYATDDKGAIYLDVMKICRELGISNDDILVIGTGADNHKIDLLEGLTPFEVKEILNSVAMQGGSATADIWMGQASDHILHVGNVNLAFERTDEGLEWIKRNKMRAYSLLNILNVAGSDTDIEYVVGVVLNALNDQDGQYHRIADLDTNGFHASLQYLIQTWLKMAAKETQDGIKMNVRAALAAFNFKDDLAKGFADGAGENLISASEIMCNKIKLINVSNIEHGSAGRAVNIFLKTLFFKGARAAQQQDPELKEEACWRRPKTDPLLRVLPIQN